MGIPQDIGQFPNLRGDVFPAVSGVPSVASSVFYVATNGDDSDAGTLARPFLTLTRAQQAVRSVNSAMQSDVTVNLREGTYVLPSTVTFDATDSGSNGFNVIYQSYPGEQAVLSGGQHITGWVSIGGGLYRAPANGMQFRQMYVNGVRAIRARTPNVGSYFRILNWNVPNRTIGITTGEIPSFGSRINEVEIVFYTHWTQTNFRIGSLSIPDSTTTITPMEPERNLFFSDWGLNPTGSAYYVENAIEFLDAPGEWYLDTVADTVTYLPRPGENMATATVIVPQVETLLRVTGTPSVPVTDIQFRGLTFAHSTWMYPSQNGFAGGFATIHAGGDMVLPGAVRVDGARDVTFERNVFQHLGACGLMFFSAVSDGEIVGNVFEDIGGTAVAIDETYIANPDSGAVLRRNVVSNNYFEGIGRDYASNVAIHLGFVDSSVISHNEITDTPYSGIVMGAGSSPDRTALYNNQVLNNHIWSVMTLLDDGAGIYTSGNQSDPVPYSLISDNYVHDLVRSSFTDGSPIVAVYLDEESNNIRVQNTVAENVPDTYHTNQVGGNVNIIEDVPNPAAVIANAGLEPAYQDIRP